MNIDVLGIKYNQTHNLNRKLNMNDLTTAVSGFLCMTLTRQCTLNTVAWQSTFAYDGVKGKYFHRIRLFRPILQKVEHYLQIFDFMPTFDIKTNKKTKQK